MQSTHGSLAAMLYFYSRISKELVHESAVCFSGLRDVVRMWRAGAATPLLEGGYLFHFNLTGNRKNIAVDDPRLEDHVADNLAKHKITESESLLIGRNFGIITDIETGPNGNLFVVSLSKGTVYEIFRP